MNLGCRFPTAAFSFSKRLKTEMKKRLVNVKEIKYFLKCLSEFKNDRHNQSACCNYKVEYIKNSNI